MARPPTQRTFMKDLQQLCRTIDASTDGQASVIGIDEMAVKVCLRPKSGYNAHAEFLLTIKCCSAYPRECPEVSFDSPIFHPNIDPSYGSVCLSLLDDWQSCYGLLDLVKAVLYLIDHPAFDSPNNSFGVLNDPAQLSTMTVRVLAGLPVKGRRFQPNTAWYEWARDNGCLPTEGEELEGVEDAMGTEGEFNQKGAKLIDESANDAALEDRESTSDTVPSFAKIRYLFDPDDDRFSWSPYAPKWSSFDVESQRILIWHPCDSHGMDTYSVFYFIEFLGISHHHNELGDHYNTLFIGNVLRECQSHPESRQTSSICPWYAFSEDIDTSYHSHATYESSLNLSGMFKIGKPVDLTLTTDFCPWSALDGKGVKALLGGLFFEGNRNRGNFTCFLDEDGDDASGSQCIARLFDPRPDHKEVSATPSESSEVDAQIEIAHLVGTSISNSEVSSTTEDANAVSEPDRESEEPYSSASLSTYKGFRVPYPSMTECSSCRHEYDFVKHSVNFGLHSEWKWIFRGTRWSIRLAPQQYFDLSMTGIRIPPWRASSGRMLSDICRFSAKNQDASNFVLLDPMVRLLVAALSPLSPLLNLMRRSTSPRPRLTGILWMTPLDAISPFYHVPVPVKEEYLMGEGVADINPSPISLRFLAVVALVTNWVAWISRIECYATLGMSRFRPALLTAPVAACLLQPLSLGCGQAPLMDLWPLWLLRRLLTLSLRLPQLSLPFLCHNHHHLRCMFPFSDLDEI